MKKIGALLIFAFLAAIKSFSQVVINDPIQAAMDTMYSKLDTSYIPYKMLLEKAYLHSNLTYFDGQSDSTATFLDVKSTAWDIPYMYLGNSNVYNGLRDTVENRVLSYSMVNKDIIPLVVLDYGFGTIDSMAFENNLLKFDGYYIKDVLPRSGNPYINDRTAVFSPLINNGGFKRAFQFILREKDYYSNYNKNVIGLFQINFDDGQGFRTINFDQVTQVSYNTSGLKKITIKIPVFNINSNTIAYYVTAHSTLFLEEATRVYTDPMELGVDQCPFDLRSYWLTADLQLENFAYPSGNKGLFTVIYGIDPATGQKRTCIKKPILFIEGIDFKAKDQPHEGYYEGFYRCNGMGVYDFIDQKELIDERYVPMSADHPFYKVKEMINELNSKGYDFVYLDFEKGADYMQKNALVVIKLINKINQLKYQSGSCEPNIIVGASMGGQVAKYALSFMEKNHLEHDSKMYVSFDSPHLGANIPIGFQIMAKFFSKGPKISIIGVSAYEDSKRSIKDKLNKPATKQLLVYHYESMGVHQLRTDFVNELAGMGDFPTETYNFGIVNGSGNMGNNNLAGLGFSPGNELFKYEASVDNAIKGLLSLYKPKKKMGKKIKDFMTSVISTPSFLVNAIDFLSQSPINPLSYLNAEATIYAAKSGQEVFSYKSPFTKATDKIKFFASGCPEVDHVAGCLRSDIHDAAKPFKKDWQNKGVNMLMNTFGHKFFSFMPTPSTMAWKATNFTSAVNLKMKDFVANMNSYSSSVYTSLDIVSMPDTNEAHVRVTDKNKNNFEDILDNSNGSSNNIQILPNSLGSSINHTQSLGNTIFINTINSGGKYYVNNLNMLGGYNQFFNNINLQPELLVYNRACENITLNTGSLFEINSLSNQYSTVNIVSGSSMVLNNLSVLRINENSKLIIMSGAKIILNEGALLEINNGSLIIEEGAYIVYNGGNVKLNGLNGKLEIMGNAIFNTDFNPLINKGVFKFSGKTYNSQQIVCNNAKITFKASNANDVMVLINQKTLLLNSTKGIEFINGTVVFEKEESKISINGKSLINGISIYQSNQISVKSALGFEVKHSLGSVYSNILCSGLKQGFYISNTTTERIIINNMRFTNCTNGCVIDDGLVSLINCVASGNNTGFMLNYIKANTLINSCQFINNNYGLIVSGNNAVNVKVEKCDFNGNTNGLFIPGGTRTMLRCNNFLNNSISVVSKINSVLDLSKGYNSFYAATGPFIVLEKASNIVLYKGYNYFNTAENYRCVNYGTCKYFITGTISNSETSCLINSSGNSYKNTFVNISHSNYNKLFNVFNNCGKVYFQEYGSVNWPLNCGQFDSEAQQLRVEKDPQEVKSDDYSFCINNKRNMDNHETINLNYKECVDLSVIMNNETEELFLEEEIAVYPNPITENEALNIRFNNIKNESAVIIYDMLGKVIYKGSINEDMKQIEVKNLTKGVYVVNVFSGETDFRSKIVVN